MSIFSRDIKSAITLFKNYHTKENNDQCLDYEDKIRIDDIKAMEIIKKAAGVNNMNEIQNFDKENRNKVIKEFKNKGISIRQIERLTGISFGVIRKT